MSALPPCAKWGRWLGREVEGTSGVGEWTLFVRDNDALANVHNVSAIMAYNPTRIWFCKEYTNYPMIEVALSSGLFKEVCVEATEATYKYLPSAVKACARIYLKVPVELKVGDHLCVGPAFNDEAFCIGQGVKVCSADYAADVKV